MTRYHVVRTAAAALGWVCEEDDRSDIPSSFHGDHIPCRAMESLLPTAMMGRRYSATLVPQVIWTDRSVLSKRVADLKPHQRLNHFAGMHCIGRKALLFRRLMRIKRKCAATDNGLLDVLTQMAPLSFSSCTELSALERHMAAPDVLARRPFFIVKPNKGCEGRGIRITRSPLDVLSTEERTSAGECLIQSYVDRPLLVEGRKFDLRLYVLLTAITQPHGSTNNCDGIHLFVHRRGLVRMCVSTYAAPTDANCALSSTHLTNYAVNKKAPTYRVGSQRDSGEPMLDGDKRDFLFLAEFIESTTELRWADVLRRIHECIVLTMLSGIGVLRREMEGTGATRGHKADGRNCFELLGFDVLLAACGAIPVLMEVNHSPSLACESDFDYSVKRDVLMDTFKLLDVYLPSNEDSVDGRTYCSFAQRVIASRPHAEVQCIQKQEVGYIQLLPDYVVGGVDTENWSEQERSRQAAMATAGSSIL